MDRNPAFDALAPRFTLARGDRARLPTAHTCVNRLVLPACTSKAELEQKLERALAELGAGFGFI